MPFAPVDDNGTQLFYYDSGKTPSERTLVIAHGLQFNSKTFDKMIQLAPSHDLRIIAINRRSYRNSTPLSQEETAGIDKAEPTEEDYRSFMAKRAKEFARLIVWLVENEGVTGNIALAAWSLGNQTLSSLLAEADNLAEKERLVIEKHLRAIIFYDPPRLVFNGARGTYAYNPLLDKSLPAEQQAQQFGFWIGAHFDHPDPSSADPAKWEMRNHIQSKPPHVTTMSPQDIADGLDGKAAMREDALVWGPAKISFWDKQAERAFTRREALKDVKLVHVWCDESAWECVATQHALSDICSKPNMREIVSRRVKGGSHFWHHEEPEAAIELFAQYCA